MVDRVLIVVEGERDKINLSALKDELRYLDASTQVSVLWMCDLPFPDGHLISANRDQTVEVIEAGGLLLSQLRDEFNAELQDWFTDISHSLADVSDWWISLLSELNFMHPAWATMVRFNIIHDQFHKREYTSCIVWGEDHLVHLCQQYCKAQSISFSGKATYSSGKAVFSEILFACFRWISNFAAEFLAYFLTRSTNKQTITADNCVYAQYPRNWRHSNTQAYYRFIGQFPVPEAETLPHRSLTYLISITRKDTLRLKDFKSIWWDIRTLKREMTNFPFMFVEGFSSFWQILRSYLNLKGNIQWWKSWQQMRQAGQLLWRDVDISHLLRSSLINTCLVDWPKNRHLEQCVVAALEEITASKLLLPIYELAEGRAVARAANKAGLKTLGVQHNSYSLGHQWRVITAMGVMAGTSACQDPALPDRITAEGPLSGEWWSQTDYPLERVVEIGAPRIEQLIPEPDLTASSRNILVLGEYHRPQLLFDWCVDHMLELGYEITLRPHPTFYQKGKHWLEAQPQKVRQVLRFSPPGLSLEQDLERLQPLCILASVTGAAVDVAFSGWPVGIVVSNWLANNSPLAATGDEQLMINHEPQPIFDWIERLSKDPEYRQQYSQACRSAAYRHYQITGVEAAKNLSGILEA